MSISQLSNVNQTGLVPQTLLGYSSDGVSAIQINPTSIILGGDLLTIPITVEISASTGLTTTRPQGLNVNCDFDMNNNIITNLSRINYGLSNTALIVDQFSGQGFNISGTNLSAGMSSNNNGDLSLYANVGNNGGSIQIENNFLCPMSFLNGINITNGVNNARIISDNGGNLDVYVNTTATGGGFNIYNENGAYMTFYGDGISINDSTNSIVGRNNSSGLTLSSGNNPIHLTTTTGTINLTTTDLSAGTINLNTIDTINLNALQTIMSGTSSCSQVILTEYTLALPPIQSGSICYYNDNFYVCKSSGWILLI